MSSGPALTLGRVGRLPRASGLRGLPAPKRGPQDVLATKIHLLICTGHLCMYFVFMVEKYLPSSQHTIAIRILI